MKHWNLKRVLSLLLVVCMVTGLLSGVSAMAEDQTANYHEISTDGLKLATEDNAAADETETEEAPYADTDVVRVFVVLEDKPVLQQGYATAASPAMLPPWQPPRRSKPSRRRWPQRSLRTCCPARR